MDCRFGVAVAVAVAAALILARPGSVSAQTALSLALVSDYDYRGVTQSAGGAALQPELDFIAGKLHLQAWSSNVSFDRPRRLFGKDHTELALSADYKHDLRNGVAVDGGTSWFAYPGRFAGESFAEYFATASAAGWAVAVHLAPNYANSAPCRPAYYVEANAEPALGDGGLRLLAHAGSSWGPYWSATIGHAYSDYALGAKQATGKNLEIALRLVGTRRYPAIPVDAPLSGAARIVLSVTATTNW